MLKGIKKSQPNSGKQLKETQTVNSNKIKQSEMEDQEVQNQMQKNIQNYLTQQKNETNQDTLMWKMRTCLNLYLNGKVQQLRVQISKLNDMKQIKLSQKTIPKSAFISQPTSGKFSYEFKQEDEQLLQQTQNKSIRHRSKPIMASNRIRQYCQYCPDNEQLSLISASNYVYLAFPKRKTFSKYFHLILAPVDHQQTMVGLNEDIITEIANFKKCLIQAFDKINLHAVFFEQFSSENAHIYIECLAIPLRKGEDLPFFFKQALETVEGNWTTHRNIIRIEKEKGGLQKQIPKKIKYFYIDFSLGYGYAHVIEDEKSWKRGFCSQILATALGMEMHQVKTTQEFSEQQITAKMESFKKIWKKYDWTELL